MVYFIKECQYPDGLRFQDVMKGYQAGDIIFDGEKGVYPHLWYPQCNKCLVSVYGMMKRR